ncbi:aminotransferase class I/II-fold pyridoxal phosphate-dependent enzyme [Chlorobium sp. N1]|uniref:pyridoxal phosphate-dependent aminotransferase n=1 Tax=Chlorobium sp. N1 TaxID=2491138 RepID=UPI00103E15EC|nr:aminotransferase class I/II-fold pyridoxal phosphate-dependent enzyme [Chlorobium sp. N1]TCD48531.1 aminotransferase class I/II-fold pyridoxal phosphate-dependent enzyme [Chlorobium sp. N1]
MSLHLSRRHEMVTQSEIRSMSLECSLQGGLNLAQGVCDTPVPEAVLRGATEAIEAGMNTYTPHTGIPELRQAIADKQERLYGMACDPESEIVVTAGATGALYSAFQALLEPGDEVILFEPFYGYHLTTLRSAGAVPVFVPLEAPGWSVGEGELEAAITPKTRGIIVNTPANPCGKVFSRGELEAVADVAIRHDLFVFTDEIYEHFLYDGLVHVPMATLPGMRERTVTISGASKTFSVTGWRIGWAIADRRWAPAIGHFSDLCYVCAPAPLQAGVARGMEELGWEYYRGLGLEYRLKRDRFCRALQDAGLAPFVPDGAYYVLADVSSVPGRSARERAMHILRTAGVASVPATAFYGGGKGESLVRFCYAKEDAVLDEACRRLREYALHATD